MDRVYSFLLASVIGCELVLGIVVAPVLFKGGFLSDILPEFGSFEAGVLMGQIFARFNYVLIFVSIVSILFEGVSLFRKNSGFYLRFSRFCLSVIVLFCACLFVFYFTDFILKAQQTNDINTSDFASIHNASEYVFKIICIAQMILFFLKNTKEIK